MRQPVSESKRMTAIGVSAHVAYMAHVNRIAA